MTHQKTVVVYKSKYGSAKQYAEWIAQELGADLFDRSKVRIEDLVKYDTIVYGGSLYAVGILGISLLKDNFDALAGKKVIVFSVGASPAHPEALESVRNENFTEAMKKQVSYFHLRGGFDYDKLTLFHKLMMQLMKLRIKSTAKKRELNNDEKGMLAAYEKPMSFVQKKWIAPILDCARGEEKAN